MMNKKYFLNKNVFLVFKYDKFTELFVDSYLQGGGQDKSEFTLLYFDEDSFLNSHGKLSGVSYVYFDPNKEELLNLAKSITFLSLNYNFSFFIERIIKNNPKIIDKMFMFITDDEVSRWKKIVSYKGVLIADKAINKKYSFNESDEYVLSLFKNFITSKSQASEIENILGRTINLVDVRLIFSILPTCLNDLSKKIISLEENKSEDFVVLFGSKYFYLRDIFSIYKIVKNNPNKKFRFNLFTPNPLTILLVICYKFYSRFLLKRNIKFNFLSNLNRLTYTFLLLECDCFILQERGGFSSAISYLEVGKGSLIVKQGSPNYILLKEDYDLDILSCLNYSELGFLINKHQNHIDFSSSCNVNKIIKIKKESIANLAKVYC